MKIKVASEQAIVQISDSGLSGKALVVDEDQVGYSCYDLVLEGGTSQEVKSVFGETFNHIYYCIYGEITFTCSDGTTKTLKTDHLIALNGSMKAQIQVIYKTRLFVVYVKEKPEGPHPDVALHSSLDEIVGTVRDVDWFRGRSRRYLTSADGFNVSIHNTWCYKEKISPLHYPNNKETAYYIEGNVQYQWGNEEWSPELNQATRTDEGLCITMDKNDPHFLHAKSLDCVTLCVFYPALKGTETHDFSKKVSSF